MHALYLVLMTLNLLVETLAGTALIAGPDGIAAAGRGGLWSMHYGFAALAVASISVWGFVYRALPQVRHAVQGILLLFHAGIALSLTLAGDQAVGQIIHIVLATLTLVLVARSLTGSASPAR